SPVSEALGTCNPVLTPRTTGSLKSKIRDPKAEGTVFCATRGEGTGAPARCRSPSPPLAEWRTADLDISCSDFLPGIPSGFAAETSPRVAAGFQLSSAPVSQAGNAS